MLKGNINWFTSDLKFKESQDVEVTVGTISNVLFDDNSIKFSLRTNVCAENPAHRQSAKRYQPF